MSTPSADPRPDRRAPLDLAAARARYEAAERDPNVPAALAELEALLANLRAVSPDDLGAEGCLLVAQCEVESANGLARTSRFEEALEIARRQEELPEALFDSEDARQAWFELRASAFLVEVQALRFLGRPQESLERAEFALDFVSRAPRALPEFLVQVRLMTAAAHYHQGDLLPAFEAGLHALELARNAGLGTLEMRALHHLANVAFDREDHAAAHAYYTQTYEAAVVAGRLYFQSQVLSDLAESAMRLDRPDEEVRPLFERALGLAREVGNETGLAYARLGLGRLALRGAPDDAAAEAEALRHFLAALRTYRHAGAATGQLDAHAELGRLLSRRPDRRASFGRFALHHLRTGLDLGERLGDERRMADLYECLGALFEARGDLAGALEHHKAFHAAHVRAYVAESEKHLRTLELRHAREETEMHRRHREALAHANRELAAANTALEAQARELERLAREDGLTGLLNRRRLDERLAELFVRAREDGAPLAVALADVDHFKRVNDTFGHATGDDVLRAVGALFRAACPDGGLAARYGGEEFVLVLPGVDGDAARAQAETLRRAVEAHPWGDLHPDLAVTLSVGVADAAAHPHHERLLTAADARLYGAKRGGRNRVEGP